MTRSWPPVRDRACAPEVVVTSPAPSRGPRRCGSAASRCSASGSSPASSGCSPSWRRQRRRRRRLHGRPAAPAPGRPAHPPPGTEPTPGGPPPAGARPRRATARSPCRPSAPARPPASPPRRPVRTRGRTAGGGSGVAARRRRMQAAQAPARRRRHGRRSRGWRRRWPDDRPRPVRVYNNSTISGLAARAADNFRNAGWTVDEVANYPSGIIPTSTVYYRPGTGEQGAAQISSAAVRAARRAPLQRPGRRQPRPDRHRHQRLPGPLTSAPRGTRRDHGQPGPLPVIVGVPADQAIRQLWRCPTRRASGPA